MAVCSRCTHAAMPNQRYCRCCASAYMRQWRTTHPPSDEQRRRGITRAYTNVLIRRGHLTRQPCQTCGAEPAQAHHPSYADPRWIIWLCPMHHRELHKSITRLLTT